MKIISKISEVGIFRSDWSKEIIKAEPQFYRASFDFAFDNGGVITKEFLGCLPYDWYTCKDLTIDSRVHMLMPSWYPCIPGYHHDDIPRTRSDGQPNYDKPDYNAKHLMGLVNGDICPTEFAIGEIDLDIPEIGSIIYKEWHPKVVEAIKNKTLESVKAKSGVYIEFNNLSFHQGTACIKPGWRWFIRVSKNTDRAKNCLNEIRTQTQVYMESPMEGW